MGRAILAFALAVPLLGAPALAGSISGQVFRDRNGNGVPDPGEEGVPAGLEVYGVEDGAGPVLRNVAVPASGGFGPEPLGNGCYVMRLTPLSGFRMGEARADCPGDGRGWPVGTRRYASPRHLIDHLMSNGLLHVALGDSIAEPASLCTVSFPDHDLTDYVGWFQDRLACVSAGAMTENNAIGGKHTTHLLEPAGTCEPGNMPRIPNPNRCDNIFDTIARNPGLVTISIGGNDWLGSEPSDQSEPFDPAEVAVSVRELIAARANLQEILSTLGTELPTSDVILNTVYDNAADTCGSTDFHNIWAPIWNRVLRDVAWGQGDRFQVAEIGPEYAHQDLNGQSCCGETDLICVDGIHPTVDGARVHLEKVWDAASGLNLGPRDPLSTTTNGDLLFPLVELVGARLPSQVDDRTAGAANPQAALVQDDTGALLPAGDGQFVVGGFDATANGIVPTQVVVVVRYRTDTAPPPRPERDDYFFEASVDGAFSAPQFTVTGWNTVVPIVGAGDNAPTRNAIPDVPQFREVRALLTRNLLDDGRQTGSYDFPRIDWSDIASLKVRFRGATNGAGADPYRVELDAVWLEIYGYVGSATGFSVYRSTSPQGLVDPANRIGSVSGGPYADLPPMAPIQCYAVDDGGGQPRTIQTVRQGSGVEISW